MQPQSVSPVIAVFIPHPSPWLCTALSDPQHTQHRTKGKLIIKVYRTNQFTVFFSMQWCFRHAFSSKPHYIKQLKVRMLLIRMETILLSCLFPFSDLGCTPTHFRYLLYLCVLHLYLQFTKHHLICPSSLTPHIYGGFSPSSPALSSRVFFLWSLSALHPFKRSGNPWPPLGGGSLAPLPLRLCPSSPR